MFCSSMTSILHTWSIEVYPLNLLFVTFQQKFYTFIDKFSYMKNSDSSEEKKFTATAEGEYRYAHLSDFADFVHFCITLYYMLCTTIFSSVYRAGLPSAFIWARYCRYPGWTVSNVNQISKTYWNKWNNIEGEISPLESHPDSYEDGHSDFKFPSVSRLLFIRQHKIKHMAVNSTYAAIVLKIMWHKCFMMVR